MTLGATIISAGERAVVNALELVYVHGLHNFGCVYESREIITTAMHAGEIATHVQTVGGEDNWLIMPDKSAQAYAVLELDLGLTTLMSIDYDVGNDVKAIPFWKNLGALLQSIQCADPVGQDVTPDHVLHTNSGVAGSLKAVKEAALTSSTTGTTESFAAGVTTGDLGSHISNRSPMRQAYFLADPSANYVTVAYIYPG
ncbi:hypothetical protein LCGC14_2425900 [marine sediment metagenome]|uniref:Uncharacterized protein n=1 Tax=marine sediment metagenome TaxID=412755 RepID=A0A0F9CAJ8_9ZZZZ